MTHVLHFQYFIDRYIFMRKTLCGLLMGIDHRPSLPDAYTTEQCCVP